MLVPAMPPVPASAAQATTLTIYSSLPLQGATRPLSEDVVLAIKLALREHGNTAGGHPLHYLSLDDATAAEGGWDANQTRANARHVALDDAAIAYIGEFNSPATAYSLPTLNEAEVLQVSPANTARGLTQAGPGAVRGEPGKYYPSGRRTYGRVVPIDDVQGAAQAELMRRRGVRRLFVLDDEQAYGRGVATFTARAARRAGIRVVGRAAWDSFDSSTARLAARARRTRADAVFAGVHVNDPSTQLFNALHRALPAADLYGPDGLTSGGFETGLTRGAQRHTLLTDPTVGTAALPPAGRAFARRFEARYGKRPGPWAVFGYAATQAVLDAVDRGGADRAAVLDGFFGPHDTALGHFRIRKSGDTTLRRFGVYRIRRGRLRFVRAVTPP
jgi:branched-chain amino acid transport system substrate-binding protein